MTEFFGGMADGKVSQIRMVRKRSSRLVVSKSLGL